VNLTLGNVAIAALWAAVAGLAAWLLTWPVRRRSLPGLLASVVATGTAASLGAVLGGVHTMLLPMRAEATLVIVAVIAGVVATVAASAVARRLTRDSAVIRAAVADIEAGRVPSHSGRPLTAELEQLRRELGETAQRLARSRDREQALESARRELVAWVSHDLRTPLAGLRAMAEALEDGVAADPDLYYKQIAASVDRLSSMVDDLFALSRIQAGSIARELEPIPLDDLVSDCLAALEPLADAQGLQLRGTGGSPVQVIGNGAELNRALTNLVANAIRHTHDGGLVEVQVGLAEPGADRPRWARVSVADECGGIPAADLPRIFDVGYRGEAARSPHGAYPAGAGLGLAIARGIVEAHDGHIEVCNTATGCRFELLLPTG
jgi:signal transduction histidine kinase